MSNHLYRCHKLNLYSKFNYISVSKYVSNIKSCRFLEQSRIIFPRNYVITLIALIKQGN